MTRTTPLRVITLHLTQIFLTDARTFIVLLPFSTPKIERETQLHLPAISSQLSATLAGRAAWTARTI
jgi:hypothetical protein